MLARIVLCASLLPAVAQAGGGGSTGTPEPPPVGDVVSKIVGMLGLGGDAETQAYRTIRNLLELTTLIQAKLTADAQKITQIRQRLAFPIDAVRDGGNCLRSFGKQLFLDGAAGRVQEIFAALRGQWPETSPRTAPLYRLYEPGGTNARHLSRNQEEAIWGPSEHLPDADWQAMIDWARQGTSVLESSHARSSEWVGVFGSEFARLKDGDRSPAASLLAGAQLLAQAGGQVVQQNTLRNQTLLNEQLLDMDERREERFHVVTATSILKAVAGLDHGVQRANGLVSGLDLR